MTIVSVCLTPGLQRSVTLDHLRVGEVNRLKSIAVDVSGKGVNVCRVLQRLGIPACCISQGGDNGEQLLAMATGEALDLRLVPSAGILRTCTSIVETASDGGCRVTEIIEPSPTVTPDCLSMLLATVREALADAEALVIAGSMAPGFPPDYQAALAALAHTAGVPVFVDLQGEPLRQTIAAGATVVKINLAEFANTFLAGQLPHDSAGREHSGILAEAEIQQAIVDTVCHQARELGTVFVLTRGANSVLLANGDDARVVPVTPLAAGEVFNPIGSGDSFMAGLIAHLRQSGALSATRPSLSELEAACQLAIACAQSNARTARPGFLAPDFVAPCA